ncbi:hypothetical protein FRB90_007126 [Tulasnella sp. 427]|nr:hypothetical protein FRB90_007126 [Tulasnella sp. 427]
MQNTNNHKSRFTIWDWTCPHCEKGTSGSQPIELDDETSLPRPVAGPSTSTSTSKPNVSIDLTIDSDDEVEAIDPPPVSTLARTVPNQNTSSVNSASATIEPRLGRVPSASHLQAQKQGQGHSGTSPTMRRMSVDEDPLGDQQVIPKRDLGKRRANPIHRPEPPHPPPPSPPGPTPSLPRPPQVLPPNSPISGIPIRPNYQMHIRSSDLPSWFTPEELQEDEADEQHGPTHKSAYQRLPDFFKVASGAPRDVARVAEEVRPRRPFKMKATRLDPSLTGSEVIFVGKAWRKGIAL